MILELPYPPSELNPNIRLHHQKKAKFKKRYKEDCYILALSNKLQCKTDTLPIQITFYPPDNRRRDIDNMLASMKSGLDGMCLAWNIDDKIFRPMTLDVGEKVKGGKVVIEI